MKKTPLTNEELEQLNELCIQYQIKRKEINDTEILIKSIRDQIVQIFKEHGKDNHTLSYDIYEKYTFTLKEVERLYPSSLMKQRIKNDPKSKKVVMEILQMHKVGITKALHE
jgi:hypothetical protein